MFAHTAAADYPGRDWGAPRGATAFEGSAGKRSAAGKGGRGAKRLDTLARLCALSARDDGIMFGRMKKPGHSEMLDSVARQSKSESIPTKYRMLGGAAYSGLQLDSLMNDPASWDFPAARGVNQGCLGGSCNALLPRPSQMQPAKTWAWLGRRVDGETSRKPVRLARLLAQDEDGSPWRADPRFLGEAWLSTDVPPGQSCRQRFRSAGVTAPRLEAKGPAEPQGSGDFVRARSTPGLKIFRLHLFSTNSEAVAAGSTQFGEAPEQHPASQRLSQRSGQAESAAGFPRVGGT